MSKINISDKKNLKRFISRIRIKCGEENKDANDAIKYVEDNIDLIGEVVVTKNDTYMDDYTYLYRVAGYTYNTDDNRLRIHLCVLYADLTINIWVHSPVIDGIIEVKPVANGLKKIYSNFEILLNPTLPFNISLVKETLRLVDTYDVGGKFLRREREHLVNLARYEDVTNTVLNNIGKPAIITCFDRTRRVIFKNIYFDGNHGRPSINCINIYKRSKNNVQINENFKIILPNLEDRDFDVKIKILDEDSDEAKEIITLYDNFKKGSNKNE